MKDQQTFMFSLRGSSLNLDQFHNFNGAILFFDIRMEGGGVGSRMNLLFII